MLPDSAAPVFPFECDMPIAGAIKQPVALLDRQLLPGLS